jgi:membrane associated rhomboid family serine protease
VIFPIGDTPNPRGAFPFVTYLLIALNAAIYFFLTMPLSEARPPPDDPLLRAYLDTMARAIGDQARWQALVANLSAYDLFVFRFGFRPADPSVVTLFSSMFLHASFLHLFGNMLFLWIYGDNVEHRLGHVKFLLAYLLGGVVAVWFHAISSPGSPIPVVGASGAISGALGFYFVFFPRNRVRLLWFLPPFIFQTFEVPARIVLGFYIVLDNILPYLLSTADAGVSHGAHIGGFFLGLGGAWIMSRRDTSHRPEEYSGLAVGERPVAETIGSLVGSGRFDEAARAYFALPANATVRLLTPQHALDLADWLAEHRHADAALVLLRRLMRDFPSGPVFAEAAARAGDLLRSVGEDTEAYQYYRAALDEVSTGPAAEAARRGTAAIDAAGRRQSRWA